MWFFWEKNMDLDCSILFSLGYIYIWKDGDRKKGEGDVEATSLKHVLMIALDLPSKWSRYYKINTNKYFFTNHLEGFKAEI